jgi:hypothetical protein
MIPGTIDYTGFTKGSGMESTCRPGNIQQNDCGEGAEFQQ